MEFGAGLGFNPQTSQAYTPRQIDYWVDAALGSDSNNGTFGSPLRSFQEAVNRSDEQYNPGFNNIFLKPGNYDGAYIDDYDLLKVFGTGVNPWDVNISDNMPSLAGGDAIYIDGGSDVRLFNVNVYGASNHGIYARDLQYLYLEKVYSGHNFGAGLLAENVAKVKIHLSTFFENGNFGAQVFGADHFRVTSSGFYENAGGGAAAAYSNQVEFISTSARDNYALFDLVGSSLDIDGDGLYVTSSNSLLVNGGDYSNNDDDGIDAFLVNSLTLLGVRAAWNGEDGADGQVYDSAVVSGGRFEHNGDEGLELSGAQTEGLNGNGSGNLMISIYGGQYFDNYDDGVDLEYFYKAQVFGMDARRNQDDGIDAFYGYDLLMSGGYLYDNYENGFESFDVYRVRANGLVSRENGEDGMETHDGYKLTIIGGSYSNNGAWGIHAHGEETQFQRVDVRYATVLDNYDGGANVVNSYLAKFTGGNFSDNYYDGIWTSNVMFGIFTDVLVQNNGGWGLRYDSGVMYASYDSGQGGSAAYGAGNGTNWNRVELTRGLYRNNGNDGIYISTSENRSYYDNVIEVVADFVVSRNNGLAGLNVGGDYNGTPTIEGYGFGSPADLDIVITGGYYSFNQHDGIYLLGVDNQDPLVGELEARLTDVAAEFNGWNGVHGSGVIGGVDGNGGGGGGDGGAFAAGYGDDSSGLIHVVRGYYAFNGYNGLSFNTAILPGFDDGGGNDIPPALTGDNGFFSSLGVFEWVVAVQNGWHGLTFDVIVGDLVGDVEVAGNGGYGGFGDTALLRFKGGDYNFNGYDGINVTADVLAMAEAAWGTFSFTAVSLEDVEASYNRKNGVRIRNYAEAYLRGDVDIFRGVYNVNDRTGVFVQGMGYLDVRQVVIIANDEIGLHSVDNTSTQISANSVIVANGVENVVIE